ncbi:hypothetical protein Tco_0017470 [Tanacetum coccineum]
MLDVGQKHPGTDISQKDKKPSKKRQNRTRDGKVCENEAQSKGCPHHGFSELHQLDTFYNALNSIDQDSLNSAAGALPPEISSDVAELKDMFLKHRDGNLFQSSWQSVKTISNRGNNFNQNRGNISTSFYFRLLEVLEPLPGNIVTTMEDLKGSLPEVVLPSKDRNQLNHDTDKVDKGHVASDKNQEDIKLCEAKLFKSSIDEPPEVVLKDLTSPSEYRILAKMTTSTSIMLKIRFMGEKARYDQGFFLSPTKEPSLNYPTLRANATRARSNGVSWPSFTTWLKRQWKSSWMTSRSLGKFTDIASTVLTKMLQRCEDIPFVFLNWEKSHFLVNEGIVLGPKFLKMWIEVTKHKMISCDQAMCARQGSSRRSRRLATMDTTGGTSW